jgi:hypothetical protein
MCGSVVFSMNPQGKIAALAPNEVLPMNAADIRNNWPSGCKGNQPESMRCAAAGQA